MTDAPAKKRSKVPLLLVVVFVLPVILAKLALDNNWFNKAATNRGELLSPILNFMPILQQSEQPSSDESKWHVLYVLPATCDEKCENALYSLNQIWVALGKESDRMSPIVISTQDSDSVKVGELMTHETLNLLKTDSNNVKKVFKDVATDGIFLADTMGNIMLRYPTNLEKQQAVMQSRDILADLRKLLKLSRIG